MFKCKIQDVETTLDAGLSTTLLILSLSLILTIFGHSIFNFHHAPLAIKLTPTQSKQLPNSQLNTNLSELSPLVGRGNAFFNQSNYAQAMQYYDKA